MKLKHKVLGAKWHDEKNIWEVEIEHEGKIFTDWCNILMNGSGLLNRWRCMEPHDALLVLLLTFLRARYSRFAFFQGPSPALGTVGR